MTEQKIRAFICIDLPDEIIKEITRVQQVLNTQKFTGKLTEPENLHLTLKFLGEINAETLEKVQSALKKIKIPQFRAKLLQTGAFVYRKSPRIVWIKVGGKEIFELQKQIDDALFTMFPKEERFMSHLTIARVKYVKNKKDFIDYIKDLSVKPISFPVNSFELKSSELTSLSPTYKTIKTYNLLNI